jgi:hypothetical protein
MNTRDKFHAWLATQGYRDDMQPLAGGAYPSERVQALWDGWQQQHWLSATSAVTRTAWRTRMSAATAG